MVTANNNVLFSIMLAVVVAIGAESNPLYSSSSSNNHNNQKPQQATHIITDASPTLDSSSSPSDTSKLYSPSSTIIVSNDTPAVRRKSSSQKSTTEAPPVEEERLLISINTNDNNERGFEDDLPISSPPSRPPAISSSHIENHKPPTSSSQTSSYESRKPTPSIVTIAIQDNGQGHRHRETVSNGVVPAVIVRPNEGGGIEIITTTNNLSSNQHRQPVRETNLDGSYPKPPSSQGHGVNRPPTTGLSQPVNRPPSPPPIEDEPYQENRPPPQTVIDSFGHGASASSLLPSSSPSSSSPSLSSSGGSNQRENQRPRLNEPTCGQIYDTRIVGGEEADPDYFQWMAAIIKSKPSDGEAKPFCGGSLITNRHVLTAAHCLENMAPRDVLIRLGSYDFQDSASSTSGDYDVDQFRVPSEYNKKTHVGDIAIMRLKKPLGPNESYKTVCMPQPRRSYVGVLGTVIGYGSQSQTFRKASPKLRQVTVPIWENRKCSQVYKKNLTESFMCAGYEEGGKDACQGDSGGPLMSEGPDQRLMIIGVVSHGIGCGSPGYPGVYSRTSTYLEWIEKNTRE